MPGRLLIKAGVDISRLKREIRRSLNPVAVIFWKYGYDLIITSTYEGTHSPSSLHYSNEAYDIALCPGHIQQIIPEIKEVLGPNFDFIRESDHFHLEYDPKI